MDESVIFETASKMPPGAERDAFLDAACGSDQVLRKRVDALLLAHENPESFHDNPVQNASG